MKNISWHGNGVALAHIPLTRMKAGDSTAAAWANRSASHAADARLSRNRSHLQRRDS